MSLKKVLGVAIICVSLLVPQIGVSAEENEVSGGNAAGEENEVSGGNAADGDNSEEEQGIALVQDLSALAGGRVLTVDGNPKEWKDVPVLASSDGNVAKWAIAQNDSYIYLYVQTNGGNQWGLPIVNTRISISYTDGTSHDKTNGIGFAGMLQLKDNFYGDIEGTYASFAPSQEKGKYEIEIAIPQSFFKNHDFTLTYCGSSIASGDITALNTLGDYVEEVPVYNGITIDGSFADWNAVAKTPVNDGSIIETAVVFDGDWIYLYLRDTGGYAATSAGDRNSGVYEFLTDTGRRTSFKVRLTGIEGVEGASIDYSNDQYEIAIPAAALKPYRNAISFGYIHGTPMISGIARMQGGGNITTSFAGVVVDGNFGDWTDYNHSLIEYSTSGAFGDDADGALYIDGSILYGHARTYRYADEKNPYNPFTIYFNNDDSQSVSLWFIAVGSDGKIDWNPAVNMSNVSTEYYLVDVGGWHKASTFDELQSGEYGDTLLGRAFLRRGSGSDSEVEYEIYLENLAEYISDSSAHNYKIDSTEMKTIQVQYPNIGQYRITIAGTSSGPVAGVILCIAVVSGVLYYKKRKEKRIA